ncbi:hypothetical protein HPB49_024589 [Dermacentor silvarum]|uniref:Uncharacterized protein n=1 Tax=Dermacentor silvarum TaxID=543639 RepID=A0ACB8D0X6_DERSI|nr:hypothetical protein HPB49_024589 [Dermacentor silvarum]
MAADELKSNRVRSKGTSCAQSFATAQKASIHIYKPEEPAALDGKSSQRRVFCRYRSYYQRDQQLISLKRISTDAAEGRNFAANDQNELLGAHAADFDITRLSVQLVLLPTLLRDESPAASERILQILPRKSAGMRKMMYQVVRYLQLVFSVAASGCFRRAIFQCSEARKNIFAQSNHAEEADKHSPPPRAQEQSCGTALGCRYERVRV